MARITDEVGLQIRYLREECGMSLRAIAAEVGVTAASVSRYLRRAERDTRARRAALPPEPAPAADVTIVSEEPAGPLPDAAEVQRRLLDLAAQAERAHDTSTSRRCLRDAAVLAARAARGREGDSVGVERYTVEELRSAGESLRARVASALDRRFTCGECGARLSPVVPDLECLPESTSTPTAGGRSEITDRTESSLRETCRLAEDARVVGNLVGAAQSLRDAKDLCLALQSAAARARVGESAIEVDSAEVDGAASTRTEDSASILARPLLCPPCSRALSESWGSGA